MHGITKHWFVLALLVTLLAACSTTSNTMVSSSARVKGHQPGDHVNKVLVVALVDDLKVRTALEGRVVDALREKGVQAQAALPLLGENYSEGKSRDQMAAEIAAMGHEAVLLVSVVDIKEEMHYNQGATNYAPDIAVQGGLGQTYTVRQNAIYEPGYFSNDKAYFLESKLYRLQPEAILWTARSKTVNPADLEAGTTGVAKAVVARLEQDDMI